MVHSICGAVAAAAGVTEQPMCALAQQRCARPIPRNLRDVPLSIPRPDRRGFRRTICSVDDGLRI